MPTISTGNPGWDQNLSTLGNALFPDPSKVGQGYYYGSQARKEQLESNKLIDQQNWKNRFMMGQPGFGLPQAAAPTWQQPDLQGAAPIVSSPSNLPMTGQAQPPLSSAIVGPTGGQALPPPTVSPDQAAARGVAMIENHPANRGTPPPVSSPTPEAPPAPNTTGSDGSVPSGDPTASGFHPASILPPGGGTKYAPPAAANGAPARAAFDLGTYIATGTAAGFDAAQLQANGAATLAAAYQRGDISEPLYHQLLGGVGAPQLGVQDSAARTSITTTGMTNATELAKQRLVTGESARQFDFKPVPVIDPTSNQPVFTPQNQTTGKRVYEPTVAATVAGHDQTYVQTDQGPGNPPKTMTAKEARDTGAAIYPATLANTVAGNTSKIDTYIHPNNPLEEKTMSAGDAARNGWVEKPKSENEMRGILDKAIARETDPDKLQELQNKRNMIATAGKAATPEEQVQNQWITDTQFQKQFAVPGGYTGYGAGANKVGVNTNPAATSPELGVTYADLTEQYFQRGPAGVRGNRVTASNEALKQLIQQGYVDPNQDRSQGMSSTSINANTYDKNGNITGQAPHFRVDIKDPDSKKVYPAGAPPKVVMRLSTAIPGPTTPTVKPPAAGPAPPGPAPTAPSAGLVPSAPPPVLSRGAGAMPPGALAAAPGQPDGKTGTVGGTPTIVRGGFAYPR